MKKIQDNIFIGILLGLVGPLIAATGFYLVKFGHTEFSNFFSMGMRSNIFSPLLSLCALVNLGTFYVFLNYQKYLVARGIILSTFIYGLVIVLLKFVV